MKRPSKKSPEQIAVDTVVKENGHQIIPQDNIKKQIPQRIVYHNVMNNLTGHYVEYDTYQLIKLAEKWIAWIRTQKGPQYIQTFWSVEGIDLDTLEKLCKDEPEFKQLVGYAKQIIGELWGKPIKKDMQTLRNRASIYLREFKEHDEHMIALRERIKHEIEKEDGLTPQQQQALFVSFMEPYLGKERKEEKLDETGSK